MSNVSWSGQLDSISLTGLLLFKFAHVTPRMGVSRLRSTSLLKMMMMSMPLFRSSSHCCLREGGFRIGSITLVSVDTSKPSDLSLEDITSADKFEYQSEEEYEEGYEVGYVDGYEEGSGYEEEPGSMEEDNYVPSDLEYKY